MKIRLSRITALTLAIAWLAVSSGLPALAQSEPQSQPLLKGNATETDTMRDTGTSLTRQDIGKQKESDKDPFASDQEDALDAPPSAFAPEKPAVPPKTKTFPLNAEQQVTFNPPFSGMPAQPVMAPQRPPVMDLPAYPDAMMQRPMPPPQNFMPSDPDASPDMMLAWDMWHKRVAATIFDRFNFFAKAAFRHSPPLAAHLCYQVTRDGHIINMNMDQKSNNVLFNVLVYQCVKSLEGDMSVLAFPQGSRRTLVAKAGEFTQNYGQEGFRYTTNDRERIPGQMRPPGQ